MYDGQPIICKEIIEDNWLEYLAYVKQRQVEEEKRQKQRQEALAKLEDNTTKLGYLGINEASIKEQGDYPRYYDMGINQFWSWYITNKVEV